MKAFLTAILLTLAIVATVYALGSAAQYDHTAFATAAQGATADTAAANALKWDGGSTGLNATTARTSLSISNVENTALSTWTGTANITTVGTIATGTWNATTISLSKGGTGATNAAGARTALQLDTFTAKVDRLMPDTVTPITTSANITVNATTTAVATYVITGNLTLNAPTGGADGNTLKLRLEASGGNRQIVISAFTIPSSVALTSPVEIASGTKSILLVEKVGSAWWVTSYISGY
jgi:hypothetical protein